MPSAATPDPSIGAHALACPAHFSGFGARRAGTLHSATAGLHGLGMAGSDSGYIGQPTAQPRGTAS